MTHDLAVTCPCWAVAGGVPLAAADPAMTQRTHRLRTAARQLPMIAALLMLAACSPSARDSTAEFPVWPAELSDCRVYQVYAAAQSLTIVRCPNSATSTTYRQGKTTRTTVVVDGR